MNKGDKQMNTVTQTFIAQAILKGAVKYPEIELIHKVTINVRFFEEDGEFTVEVDELLDTEDEAIVEDDFVYYWRIVDFINGILNKNFDYIVNCDVKDIELIKGSYV